ncbi:MAG TPA: hypothetical protein VHO24_03420 [Opitutaceae bacterium]|nr:hypothetical protein [Opitutaceae bacterium]
MSSTAQPSGAYEGAGPPPLRPARILYLNGRDLQRLGVDWREIMGAIREAIALLSSGDYDQPIKSYIHLAGGKDRVIAMPAYLGGSAPSAGLKWIASVPANLQRGLPRAHAITIVNHPETGAPECLVNSTLLSARRTAAVSGVMLEHFLARRVPGALRVGICGMGEIGLHHLAMFRAILGERMISVSIYDIDERRAHAVSLLHGCEVAVSAETLLRTSDIFLTCTTSMARYLLCAPKPGALVLNISLRDFQAEFVEFVDHVVVDQWSEVCRKGTDIERMHAHGLLRESDVIPIERVVNSGALATRDPASTVMFNPMGMAIFDVAVTALYRNKARALGVGLELE